MPRCGLKPKVLALHCGLLHALRAPYPSPSSSIFMVCHCMRICVIMAWMSISGLLGCELCGSGDQICFAHLLSRPLAQRLAFCAPLTNICWMMNEWTAPGWFQQQRHSLTFSLVQGLPKRQMMEGWGAKGIGQKNRPGIGKFTPFLGVRPQDGWGLGGVEWEGGSGIVDLGTKYSWNLWLVEFNLSFIYHSSNIYWESSLPSNGDIKTDINQIIQISDYHLRFCYDEKEQDPKETWGGA